MGAIIREAWNLYWKHFAALATIMLVIWLPCEFAENWIKYNVLDLQNSQGASRLERLIDAFIGIIATSGVYYYLNEVAFRTEASVGQALGAGFTYWWPMFVTRVVVRIGLILGFLLLILPGIYLAVRLALCELLVMTEDVSGMDAARRSFDLTKGKFWRLLACLFVGSLPAIVPIMGIGAVLTYVDVLAGNWLANAIGYTLINLISAYIFTLIRAIYVELLAEEERSGAVVA